MKTQFFKRGSWALTLAIFPLAGGCGQPTGTSSQSFVTLAVAEPAIQAVAGTNAAPATGAPESLPPPPDKAEAVPASLDEKPLPASIKVSSPLAEVIKLAQAGVDEGVLFAFITNSRSTFSLGSDEIIYLNDIGVPNNVVTTMIEHDQAMKQYWADAASAQAAATTPAPPTESQPDQTAAAPSYVNPPQAAPVEPPQAVVNNNYFYDTLSPYGSWVNLDGYGMCWQPTAVVLNRSWQPYCDRGRWIYSDAGWYWLSDYSWGATTFHYGRWLTHPRYGWCWWPDRVWAPSWVTWRYSGDYCGWAPLPPHCDYRSGFGFTYYGNSVGFSFNFGLSASCYSFVPVSRFCDPRPSHHRVRGSQVTQVFNNTTVINNYGSGNNNTVINRGIAPERIASVTRTEIRKVSIREAGSAPGRGGRSERLDPDGRTLAVHRPQLPESRNDASRNASGTTDKASRFAPSPTIRDTRGTAVRANPTTPAQNTREELRPSRARSGLEQARPTTGTPAPMSPAATSAAVPHAPTTIRSRQSPPSKPIPNASTRPAQSAPTVTAPPQANPQAPGSTRPAARSSSLVVIGKRDGAQPQGQRSPTPATQGQTAELEQRDLQTRGTTETPARQTPVARPNAQQNQFSRSATAPQPQATAPVRTYNPPPSAPQQSQRQEIPRATRTFEERNNPRPSYSPPAPVQRPVAPSYSPPPAPAPQYNRAPAYSPPPSRPQPSSPVVNAPRSSPAPSYSPPASAPAPRQAPPPARSDSGPKGRERQ